LIQVQIIKEYFFDLTGKKVNPNKIEEYEQVDGVRFIAPIIRHDEKEYILAFKKIPGSFSIRRSYGINTLVK
jgi:hypothetical protein